ncbi:MAG: hydantoinase B/oxoprolinase family protein, partial [Fervidicoccaceae archaeon]|nr:hydantoinase B/oxoprolinase family protein [Fervidicoccaceae archaeon]
MLSYVYKSLAFTAEEMGVTLKRAAFSPNIRDRMDHSCVIADGDGRIVAQAEHIPVHLGSFHVGLREFLSWIDKHGFGLSSGDVIATNDPFIT